MLPNGALAHEPVEHALDRAIHFGAFIVGGVETFAAGLARSELGAIDLPPVVETPADRSHVQTVAPLYLAAELEAAAFLPSVEALAGVFASGGIPLDLGEAGRLLHAFWQARNQRFAPRERQAFFQRLFGTSPAQQAGASTGSNVEFESLLLELASGLATLGASQPGNTIVDETRVRESARQLMANVLPRSGGMTLFAARDLITSINDALQILKQPLVQRAVGGRGVWDSVSAIAQRYLHKVVDVEPRVTRGKSGMLILTWLAEVLPLLDDPARPLIDVRHQSVIAAAVAWLQASLPLYEHPRAPENGPAGRTSAPGVP